MIITVNQSFEILVIILSVTLAIFLILAIAVSILSIKLLRKANRVADNVESVANNIESLSASLKDAAGPATILRSIMGAMQGFRRK